MDDRGLGLCSGDFLVGDGCFVMLRAPLNEYSVS